MCQGNGEVTAAHPFVLCDSHIDYFLLAENSSRAAARLGA